MTNANEKFPWMKDIALVMIDVLHIPIKIKYPYQELYKV